MNISEMPPFFTLTPSHPHSLTLSHSHTLTLSHSHTTRPIYMYLGESFDA